MLTLVPRGTSKLLEKITQPINCLDDHQLPNHLSGAFAANITQLWQLFIWVNYNISLT
jgi:hypothetical protein